MSILMGLVANFPIALAAGLGLNAVVAYSIAALPGMTWPDAMGLVVLEGLIILVLVLTGFRTAVFKAVPMELKTAISVGHRPVHRVHRARRLRASCASRRAWRPRSSSASTARSPAGRCWSSSSACCSRSS